MIYWAKDTAGFLVKNRSLEQPFYRQTTYLTPSDQFFVCNSGTTPKIAPEDYRLTICGDAVETEITLSLADLQALPQHTVPAIIECAGNHRVLYEDVMGEQLNKRPDVIELKWGLGAVGMAEWRGVPLHILLERAGITEAAYHVSFTGGEADSRDGEVKVPIPVAKAMDADTIIALEMNGEPLPLDHGFPARALVPGWIGTCSVKWLSEIDVRTDHLWVKRNTEKYVLMGEHWPQQQYAPALGAPISEQNIKSSLALPWPAELPPGRHTIAGFARAPSAPIREVDWSADGGAHWHPAEVEGPNEKYGWAPFHFEWTATPGDHALMTRATDTDGNRQPMSILFNNGGYMFNAVHPHPVVVAEI